MFDFREIFIDIFYYKLWICLDFLKWSYEKVILNLILIFVLTPSFQLLINRKRERKKKKFHVISTTKKENVKIHENGFLWLRRVSLDALASEINRPQKACSCGEFTSTAFTPLMTFRIRVIRPYALKKKREE